MDDVTGVEAGDSGRIENEAAYCEEVVAMNRDYIKGLSEHHPRYVVRQLANFALRENRKCGQ